MALTTEFSFRVAGSITKTLGALSGLLKPDVQMSMALASGILLDQADKMYYSRPTIAGSATLSLDVATSGGLLDVFGDAFAIAKLKLLVIKSLLSLCPNTMNLTRPAAGVPLLGATGDLISILPGGALVWIAPSLAGVPVTATTADLIEIVNTAAGNVQPEILIIGASA